MANLAVFLYADRLGLSRVKSPGTKPGFSPIRWMPLDNGQQLLQEPIHFATLLREMIGDREPHKIYLNVWPAAYHTVLFSHGKNRKSNINRLRQAELEMVFRGGSAGLYANDLPLDRGRYSFAGKSRRLIYVIAREKLNLLLHTFRAERLIIRRVAPMDAAVAEAALHHWAPDKNTTHAVMMLEDGCTSYALLKKGAIQMIRVLPDGFDAVMEDYRAISGMGSESCRQLIMTRGLRGDDDFPFAELPDRVLVACNHLVNDLVRTLYSVFSPEERLASVLLCGSFARVEGLQELMSERLGCECVFVESGTLQTDAKNLVLDEALLEDLFPYTATTLRGVDLLHQRKRTATGRVNEALAVSMVAVAAAGVMAITPLSMHGIRGELSATRDTLRRPEYVAVQELIEKKESLEQEKKDLEEAIAQLPHGATRTAAIMDELISLTNGYGTVSNISVDYNTNSINLSFATSSYGLFVGWQEAVEATGRLHFVSPPSFEGNGIYYTANAILTSTDFDVQESAEK